MTLDFSTVKPLALALEVLRGFTRMAGDQERTPKLLNALWEEYTGSIDAGQLSRIYNSTAADEEPLSEPIARIGLQIALQTLQDALYGVRIAWLRDETGELRDKYDISDMQELETYLHIAATMAVKSYEHEGETRYYDAEDIVEAAIRKHKSSPLIGVSKTPAPVVQ